MTRLDGFAGFVPPRRWRAWAVAEPVLAGLDLGRLRVELAEGDQERSDELLAALVRLALVDPDAQTVLVGCLWPGIAARAARYARRTDREDATALVVDELIADLTSGRHIDVARFVASTLLARPAGHLRRAMRRERDIADRTDHRADPDTAATSDEPSPSAALLLWLAVDAGTLSGPDAWLIRVTDIEGHSLRWAARRLGISYAAAIKRRQRAKAAWQAWWDRDQDPSRESSRESRPASRRAS